MKILCYITLLMLISGCATQVPTAISKPPEKELTIEQVQMDIDKYSGSQVRWGGVITKVDNQASQTWVEIVTRKLSKNGQPLSDSQSHGRFIASFATFIDPAVYKVGTSITVVGTITEEHVGMIGEYAYKFPVVTVSSVYLWPKKVRTPYRRYYPAPWPYQQPWPYYYQRHPHSPWPYYYRPYPFSR